MRRHERLALLASRIVYAGMTGTRGGRPRTRPTTAERARRNAQMARRKAEGATWDQVAAEFGVAKSTARDGVADHRTAAGVVMPAGATLADLDPGRLFTRAIGVYVGALDTLERLAEDADQDSVRLGAVKAQTATVTQMLNALALTGLLPAPERVLLARVQAARARAAVRDHADTLLRTAA